MKKFALLLVILFGTLHAYEYLMDKDQYFPELKDSCNIKVRKSLTLDIYVTFGKGMGNCSGDTTNGYFSCTTSNGKTSGVNGVNAGINWILNNYQ